MTLYSLLFYHSSPRLLALYFLGNADLGDSTRGDKGIFDIAGGVLTVLSLMKPYELVNPLSLGKIEKHKFIPG